jgi:hypothetical protein
MTESFTIRGGYIAAEVDLCSNGTTVPEAPTFLF